MKRIRIGKYLTNLGVIGAVLAVFGVIRQTRDMPRDWRVIILWVIWLLGLVLAVLGVAKRASDEEFQQLHR